MNIFDFFGWFGAVIILYAYYIVSAGKVSGNSLKFQFYNITGALFLVIYTYQYKAFASMVVNIIWVAIGLKSLISIRKIQRFKS